MKEFDFRAIYKPDIVLGNGLLEDGLIFYMKKENDELWFVSEGDSDLRYPFAIPFIDDDWVVEQFTGLYDVNGKKIFEGDVVAFNVQDYNGGDHFYTLPVVYQGSSFGFRIKSETSLLEPDCWEDLDIVQSIDDQLEVVDTIY